MAQIICKDVSLGYEGKTVCENVNFVAEAGDYICIVGDNGSGKSTLMRALLRLKAVQKGEIALGDGVSECDIGYLPQQIETRDDFPATVCEIVRSGFVGDRGFHPFISKAQRLRAEKNMRCMGIESLARRPFCSLSGGQKQRVLLARALCATDKILLLDEPISGLDPVAAAEMYGAILHLNRDHGTTIIMITHELSAITKYANRVLHMSDTPTFYDSVSDFCRDYGLSYKEGGNA